MHDIFFKSPYLGDLNVIMQAASRSTEKDVSRWISSELRKENLRHHYPFILVSIRQQGQYV